MITRALLAAATASLVLAPVAANAGTSAASMTVPVTYGSHTTSKTAAKKKGAQFVLPVLAVVVAGVGLGIATGVIDDGNNKSPGAA